MRQHKFGRLVFISSAGAFMGSVTGHVAYGASKAGMLALMKVVAKEFAMEGILANAIAPGSIDTPITGSRSRIFSSKV
jgi:NAD(P)-dependent dehydrogenase (short-subunit alcohol dehydrogenase family)